MFKKIFAKKTDNKNFVSSQSHAYLQDIASARWTSRNYQQFADEAYRKNVIAHRCINLISSAVSSVDLLAKDGQLSRLLSQPNPNISGKEFFEKLISYRLISGNSYILLLRDSNNIVRQMHLLRPDKVSAVVGKKDVVSYEYRNGDNVKRFTKSDIIHLKTFNPMDDIYGMSPIDAAAYSIDQHNQAGVWNQALLQNGAKPSGALVVNSKEGYLSDEQFSRLKSQLNDDFAGAINAGRPLLLEGGLEWREMSMSPKDMDFLDTKHSSARDIALAFGVPAQMLSIPGDNTYSNLQEARLALWEQTVLPMLDSIINGINNNLSHEFAGHKITYSKDNITALAPRREAIWKRISQADFLSDEEKRKILGVDNS